MANRLFINFHDKVVELRNALLLGQKVWGGGVSCQRYFITDRHLKLATLSPNFVFRFITNNDDGSDGVKFFNTANDAAWAMLKATDGNVLFTIEKGESNG